MNKQVNDQRQTTGWHPGLNVLDDFDRKGLGCSRSSRHAGVHAALAVPHLKRRNLFPQDEQLLDEEQLPVHRPASCKHIHQPLQDIRTTDSTWSRPYRRLLLLPKFRIPACNYVRL